MSEEKKQKKQDAKMAEVPLDPKNEGDNRTIAGFQPLWIRRMLPKKDPQEDDKFEQRNIFALPHADFRAFVYDMLSQIIETCNALEKELGKIAVVVLDLEERIPKMSEKIPGEEPEDETDQANL